MCKWLFVVTYTNQTVTGQLQSPRDWQPRHIRFSDELHELLPPCSPVRKRCTNLPSRIAHPVQE